MSSPRLTFACAVVVQLSLFGLGCGGSDDKPSGQGDQDQVGGDNDGFDHDQDDVGLPSTANSITRMFAAGRADPEGVAPTLDRVSVVGWRDARGDARSVTLGAYLYQYDFSFNDGDQTVTRSANDDAYGHEGFGYVVSHNTQTGNSPLGKANAPTKVESIVFSGGHHAVHRIETLYDRDKEGGGEGIKIPVVIQWMVATGHDHPIWSVTWKMNDVVNPNGISFDTYRMDMRGPYGSLNFDGAASRGVGDAISTVGWGDYQYRFASTGTDFSLQSPWTYQTANRVSFVRATTKDVNAEMGIVATRADDPEAGYPDRVNGRERNSTSALAYPGKGNCVDFGDARNYSVPCVAGWPYQLMNYDWDPSVAKPVNEGTGTKLIAWGTGFGWLGASTFDSFAGARPGTGERAHAAFIVLGPKCRLQGGVCNQDGDVFTTIAEVEALVSATVDNVTIGTLATQVPAGPGATLMKATTNGYDPTYAAYTFTAADNRVSFRLSPAAGKPLHKPIIAVHGYTASLPTVSVNGTAQTVNDGTAASGVFVSRDMATNTLWITLNATVSAATVVAIAP